MAGESKVSQIGARSSLSLALFSLVPRDINIQRGSSLKTSILFSSSLQLSLFPLFLASQQVGTLVPFFHLHSSASGCRRNNHESSIIPVTILLNPHFANTWKLQMLILEFGRHWSRIIINSSSVTCLHSHVPVLKVVLSPPYKYKVFSLKLFISGIASFRDSQLRWLPNFFFSKKFSFSMADPSGFSEKFNVTNIVVVHWIDLIAMRGRCTELWNDSL